MKKTILAVIGAMLMFSCNKSIDRELPSTASKNIPGDAVLELSKEKESTARKNPHGNPHDNPPPPTVNGSGVVLIDLDGQVVTNPYWNGGITFTCAPATVSSEQKLSILNRVKQDYAQFSLTITTDENIYNTFPENKRIRCIVTDSWQWYGYVGGVAYLNSYLWYGDKECFIFSSLLSNNEKYISDATSHECGHTLGLRHQSLYDESCNKVAEYLIGDAIMGNSYAAKFPRWIIGQSSAGCNVIQNDTLIISNTIKQ